MAKSVKVRTESGQWVDLASATTDLAPYSTTAQMNNAIDNAKGLVLINSTSFSTVTSVEITNCFSSTYTNYKVLFYQTHQPTANREVTLQLLSGTTPATSSYYQGMSGINATGGAANSTRNNGSDIVTSQIWDTSPDGTSFDMTILKPFLANRTNFTITNFNITSGVYFGQSGGALHSAQTSYNGFRLAVSGTNFGGVIKVYGIKD
jgi:hypothetical protein